MDVDGPTATANGELGQLVTEISPQVASVHPTGINCVRLTSNGRWLFTGAQDGEIRKFDFVASLNGKAPITSNQRQGMSGVPDAVGKGAVLVSSWENRNLDSKNSPVFSMELQSEALWMVTGCQDGSMRICTVRHDEGDCKGSLQQHTDAVSALQLHGNERRCFSGSWDKTMVDWDLDVGRSVRQFGQSKVSQVTSMRLQPDSSGHGGLLLTSSIDGAVAAWDLRTPEAVATSFPLPERTPPWAMSACWSGDGQRIFCGRREAAVDEWDIRRPDQSQRLTLPKGSGPVSSVLCLDNNRQLLCASNDNMRLWLLDELTNAPSTGMEDEVRIDRMRFLLVPGHSFGMVSDMCMDETRRFLITVSGDRGWPTRCTNAMIIHTVA
ncbi:WD40-repeat-containing domain protein [Hyaloraphidium curvatum]|nr:WD40-repeat-containing domain protein [Hyaloraphidium curvatum]